MESFVERVAQHILTNYPDQIHQLAVVFPNRRAGTFLKRTLARLAGKPIWSPSTFSTEEFMVKLSGMTLLDNLSALFKLYQVYTELEGEKADTFEKFMGWGPTLVKDFNEIDLFQIDARQLLNYLSDVEKLKQWNVGDPEPTPLQKEYLEFWEKLSSWYLAYTQVLKQENSGYQGLIFREVAQSKLRYTSNLPFKKIILAGFNALNTCEEELFSFLIESGQADMLWDLDSYYTQDPIQEAGYNFRKLANKAVITKAIKPLEVNYLSELPKKITITGVPMQTAQARSMQLLLEECATRESISIETAIVLGNEELIYPVLSSIPVSLGNFNATLGLPYGSTKSFSFMMIVLELMEYSNLHHRISNRLLLSLCLHPYAEHWLGIESIRQIQKNLQEKKIKFGFSFEELMDDMSPKNQTKFQWLKAQMFNPTETCQILNNLVEEILEKLNLTSHSDDLETEEQIGQNLLSQELYFTKEILEKLGRFIPLLPSNEISLKSLIKIINLLAAKESIPLVGEPLKGLQVMGMLETRNLDFKNIFLLGFNEGKIPSGENTATFISNESRFHFELPTQHERDAVFAYHFYRLMQRAENIWLIYDTDEEKGEPSRFLLQVEKEWSKINKNLSIEYRNPFQLPTAAKEPNLLVKKNPNHLESIWKIGQENGFSPTALNSFRKCSLQYYLKYLARIQGEEREETQLEYNLFGTIIHACLETLFTPFIGTRISKEIVEIIQSRSNEELEQKFEELTHIAIQDAGRYIIDLEIAKTYISNYLDKLSEELTQETILYTLEKTMEWWIDLGEEKRVKISGKTDRIDRIGSDYFVLDYKTGKIDKKELNLNEWEELLEKPNLDKVFQLISYSWLLNRSEQVPPEDIVPAFISFRKLNDWHLKLTLSPGISSQTDRLDKESLVKFEEIIKTILNNLLDINQNFTQTENKKICESCDYKKLCSR
ncbi:MAG: PD-(D/E)XK nuclease family protein [Bacteroidia bacterium]|nr:PD-(D/E)XK nuclease family protein [Bacteroidia bacterium]